MVMTRIPLQMAHCSISSFGKIEASTVLICHHALKGHLSVVNAVVLCVRFVELNVGVRNVVVRTKFGGFLSISRYNVVRGLYFLYTGL